MVGKAQLLQMVLDVLGVDVVRGGAPAGLLAGLAACLLGVDGKSLGQQRGLQQQVAVALMGRYIIYNYRSFNCGFGTVGYCGSCVL